MSISNTVYSFEDAGSNKTRVNIQSTKGLVNNNYIDIIRSTDYRGTYIISNVTPTSFNIDVAFVSTNQGAIWQVARSRPAIVNPEGETIDSLRQAVNAISGDLGNKNELDVGITDKRDIVLAINTLKSEQLLTLILSIATN